MSQSQNNAILRDLKRGRRITPRIALEDYGSFRLSARIYDLRRKGYLIHSKRVQVGDRTFVCEYKLLRVH